MPTDVYYPCRPVPLLKDGELKVAQNGREAKKENMHMGMGFHRIGKKYK